MATTYKVLGQASPAATTQTAIYTVPSSTQAVISSIVICNRLNSTASFRISVRPNGESLSNKHYIAYDSVLEANEILSLTLGITVDSSDVIDVYASNTNISFSVFGSEIS